MDLFENLFDNQIEAVKTIDEDLEIIACAGAGKIGVVTRRIINILKSNPDILPKNIVAFTFTEKAAEELKSRVYKYGEAVLGNTKGFANMYIGTIHGFCLKMLQEYIAQFQKFTVLDEIKTKLYIEKNYNFCGMPDLGLKIYTETNLFLSVMSTLNENWFERDKRNASKLFLDKPKTLLAFLLVIKEHLMFYVLFLLYVALSVLYTLLST